MLPTSKASASTASLPGAAPPEPLVTRTTKDAPSLPDTKVPATTEYDLLFDSPPDSPPDEGGGGETISQRRFRTVAEGCGGTTHKSFKAAMFDENESDSFFL